MRGGENVSGAGLLLPVPIPTRRELRQTTGAEEYSARSIRNDCKNNAARKTQSGGV